ncbi:hypothetical protein [Pelagerythrobacter marinus]|uniref:hypothetical protein n=1 Tax=Pelagerythrobacter marinus TaxID=538382 RepID=UPI0020374243|nr:hypothetical protein [Pelagerythrobacter marinus]USA39556.1 hypothetical protein NCF86_14930 [Pelagerythrobacter marinus]WPZ06271.1 hypothetical protein T8T98_12730 [Pelagerythrobacter marinus]
MRPASIHRETMTILREIAFNRSLRIAALLLLPYAGVLVGLDVAAHYGRLTEAHLPVQFFLSSDGGFGEWLEYSLTMAVSAMLFVTWLWEGASVYLANALLFAWLTLDNSAELHERFGHAFAHWFEGWPLPVGANDIGEASLFLAIGAVWIAALLVSLHHARLRAAIESVILAGCIAAAAFFGVVMDLVVVWGDRTPAMREFATFVEDGGEFAMICIAFLVALALFDEARRRRGSPA